MRRFASLCSNCSHITFLNFTAVGLLAGSTMAALQMDTWHSWLVLIAAFLAQMIMMGMFLCFGIYVVVLADHFAATRSQVALVGSITFATKCLTGAQADASSRSRR